MAFIIRFFKTVIGILLILLAIAVAKSFCQEISSIASFTSSLVIFERGALAYLLYHIFIAKPVSLYVFGHESVHVLATWICGGRVESFNVRSTGGSVVTSKTNIFIELSPYFVPIYTILLAPVFALVSFSFKGIPDLASIFLFLVGVTLAFHFAMTVEVLRMKQPDVAKSGVILSLVIIFVFNLFIITAVFSPFFHTVSFVSFVKTSAIATVDIYQGIYDGVRNVLNLA